MSKATEKQIKCFRDQIAQRQWDTGVLLEGREPEQNYMELLLWCIVQGPENCHSDLISRAIDILYCFKGFTKRTYEEATAGIDMITWELTATRRRLAEAISDRDKYKDMLVHIQSICKQTLHPPGQIHGMIVQDL